MNDKTIYDLKLHETITITCENEGGANQYFGITRVPGGWVYTNYTALVFVPYNKEFTNG